MKRTLACFFAALVLTVVAIAVPQRAKPATSELALDTDGVRELRIAVDSRVEIEFDSVPGLVTWPGDGRGDVAIRREGDILFVTSPREGYSGISLQLPPHVHVVTMGNGTITANVALPELTVFVDGSVQFDADVGRLAFHEAEGRNCRASCTDQLYVDGEIGALTVTARRMSVSLNDPEGIGSAELRLGPGAHFSLLGARSLANLRVLPLDTDTDTDAAHENDTDTDTDGPTVIAE